MIKNDSFLFRSNSPVLGLLQVEPSYSTAAEPRVDPHPSGGSPSACLPVTGLGFNSDQAFKLIMAQG